MSDNQTEQDAEVAYLRRKARSFEEGMLQERRKRILEATGRINAIRLLKSVFDYAEHPELPDDLMGEIGYFLMHNDIVNIGSCDDIVELRRQLAEKEDALRGVQIMHNS